MLAALVKLARDCTSLLFLQEVWPVRMNIDDQNCRNSLNVIQVLFPGLVISPLVVMIT